MPGLCVMDSWNSNILINVRICCSVAKSYLTLCNPRNYSMPGLPVLHYPSECAQIMSIESLAPSNHLILCRPLFLLPSVFPSIRVFSNELALCIRWPKYWSFSISPSKEYSGLIPVRIDCFDLIVVHGTLKSLLQHQNLKASILHHSAEVLFNWGIDQYFNHHDIFEHFCN